MPLHHADRQMFYVAAEPDKVEGFKDQTGGIHATREAAIDANFQVDLNKAARSIFTEHPDRRKFEHIPALVIVDYLKAFAEMHPDLTRVLIGDREAT